MSQPFTIVLLDDHRRRMALDAVRKAHIGQQVQISMPKRTNAQNRRLWDMMQAIVDAGKEFNGQQWQAEDWYELLWSAFLRGKKMETGQTVVGLAGEVLTLGRFRPSQADTPLFSEWMEMVSAWMVEHHVPWGDDERDMAQYSR